MALTSDDLFKMAAAHQKGDHVPLAKYYVLCVSIELGLKAAVLASGCTSERKGYIKRLSHDLVAVHEGFAKTFSSPLGAVDLEAISKINTYFKNKSLEYIKADLLVAALKGFQDFPEVDVLVEAARKVSDFLRSNDFFINAKTDEPSVGGAITIA